MKDITLSQEFIREMCSTYNLNDLVMQEILDEHKQLKLYLVMMRAAIEASDEPNADYLAMQTRIIAHLDNTVTVIKRLQNIARQVNSVIEEIEI